MKRIKGFTLTEVIITMILVITLALVSMPLYKGRYSNKAKIAEGYALLGAIKDAQINYYNEYGYFFCAANSFASGVTDVQKIFTFADPVLGINAVNNKYYSSFCYNITDKYNAANRTVLLFQVQSKAAGTITQKFTLSERNNPVVINGSTDLSI